MRRPHRPASTAGAVRSARTAKAVTRVTARAAAVGAAIVLLTAPGASAHIGVDEDEIDAGESTTLSFAFGHGCEGSPTRSLRFQIPEAVVNAQPFVHPGWDIEVEREQLTEPAEAGHGQQVTDRASIITFTAQEGNEVPDELRDEVSIRFTAPQEPGQLWFKVIQGCVEGETPWIDEWDGTGEEPEHLAPSVMVVAGDGDDHDASDGSSDGSSDDVAADAEDDDEDDSGSDALAIAALIVGALGLAVGAVALVRGRAPKTT